MKSYLLKLSLVMAFFLFQNPVHANNRILWLDSYDLSNEWSKGIGEAITKSFEGNDVNFKVFHMDTKKKKFDSEIRVITDQAVKEIRAFKPQVVIASDDAASKYVVVPYFKNADIPFVFCGVNHSAVRYGYPFKNITGILEIDPVDKLIFSLSRFRPIDHIGYLAEDGTTGRVNGEFYKEQTRISCTDYYVSNFEEWQEAFQRAQNEVDVLIIGNYSAIKNWDDDEARQFVLRSTTIPTGGVLDFTADLSFVSCIKVAEEQGQWAAETALKIADGTSPSSIPIATPQSYKLILNMKIAKKLGIKFPKSYLEKADRIIQ